MDDQPMDDDDEPMDDQLAYDQPMEDQPAHDQPMEDQLTHQRMPLQQAANNQLIPFQQAANNQLVPIQQITQCTALNNPFRFRQSLPEQSSGNLPSAAMETATRGLAAVMMLAPALELVPGTRHVCNFLFEVCCRADLGNQRRTDDKPLTEKIRIVEKDFSEVVHSRLRIANIRSRKAVSALERQTVKCIR